MLRRLLVALLASRLRAELTSADGDGGACAEAHDWPTGCREGDEVSTLQLGVVGPPLIQLALQPGGLVERAEEVGAGRDQLEEDALGSELSSDQIAEEGDQLTLDETEISEDSSIGDTPFMAASPPSRRPCSSRYITIFGGEKVRPEKMGVFAETTVKGVSHGRHAGRPIYASAKGMFMYYWDTAKDWCVTSDYTIPCFKADVKSFGNEESLCPVAPSKWMVYQGGNWLDLYPLTVNEVCELAVKVTGAKDYQKGMMGYFLRTDISPTENQAKRPIYVSAQGNYLYYWAPYKDWLIGPDYKSRLHGVGSYDDLEAWCPTGRAAIFQLKWRAYDYKTGFWRMSKHGGPYITVTPTEFTTTPPPSLEDIVADFPEPENPVPTPDPWVRVGSAISPEALNAALKTPGMKALTR